MKKILAILVAAMMIACLSVTAFAVTDTEVDNANIPSSQIGEGKTVAAASDVTVVEWHNDWTTEGKTDKTTLKAAVENTNAADNVEASVQYLLDVSTTDGSTTAKLQFDMPTGKKLAYVLGYNATTDTWEKLEASYADGVLTVTSPNGWSHVAITVQSTGTGGQTSPQTGEVTTSVYVACAAVMAVVAVAFFIKSRKAA